MTDPRTHNAAIDAAIHKIDNFLMTKTALPVERVVDAKAALSALRLPEDSQPEPAEGAPGVKPRYFALQSATGAHVGMWDDGKIAALAHAKEHPDGEIIEMVPLSALTSSGPSVEKWQPIETAPKDDTPHIRGTWICDFGGRPTYWQADSGYLTEYGYFVNYEGEEFSFRPSDYSHWTPLLAPPLASDKGAV
ncbi:hypothetical protein ACRARG_04755 [Pseudooceanicola sp. C21-150M6]|uniref:hypothetical protein n=1 Tax=Pseudooceanicola sp. C21-150M6 TaxID=3434355 RepID=UPI003D7FCCC5